MDTHLVLTVIGRDRPGLVSLLSEAITSEGGNWLDTRMANLAGQFAGILMISVPQAKTEQLTAALKRLEREGLRLVIERAGDVPAPTGTVVTLDLVGLDRPGIVRDLSRLLAAQQVSIVDLESERAPASFSGEPMFKARARLQLPEGLGVEKLRKSVENLANEMMVDIAAERRD